MHRKTDISRGYNAGKGKTNQELIHLHMSNHYRRILNAKKAVDNSPPYCYKLKKLESRKPGESEKKRIPPFENLPLTDRSISTNSNKDSYWGGDSGASSSRYHKKCVPKSSSFSGVKRAYDNMNSIACDTKEHLATYRKKDCTAESKEDQKEKQQKGNNQQKPSKTPTIQNTSSSEPHESAQKRKFTEQNKTEKTSNPEITCSLEAPNSKLTKICNCDGNEIVLKKITFNPKEQSLTSSRDSAYNGGVSSLPESRSPTPDNRKKKECCCCCYCEKKEGKGKFFDCSKSLLGVEGSPKMSLRSPTPPLPPPGKSHTEEKESFKKMQEDALYVKFIQDITTEILDKNLYTNKALKKIMKKHVKNNLKKLQKDRMLKEVENLRIQLGIPEDKKLLELESKEEIITYPLISDSEFVMPKNNGDGKMCFSGGRSSDKIGKSISAVISLTRQEERMVSGSETEDMISVIQVTKAIRERKVEKSVEKEFKHQNSSEESERPSEWKKRPGLKIRKPKFPRTDSSSSSECERMGKYSRKFQNSPSKDKYLGNYGEKPSFLLKNNRNVSFWKNPDLNLRRTYEVKQKRITRGKESLLHCVKTKND